MLQKANIHKRYRSWLGMITLFCLGIASWFLYDGAIAYPRQRVRALKYQELKEADKLDEWKDIAKEQGWPTKDPGEPKTKTDSNVQFFFAGCVLAPPGLLCLFFYIRTRGRWIEMDDDGFRTSWGRQLKFDEIVALDKKKWKSKGIAKVCYKQNDRKKRLVLDDWKFNTDETKAMVREIEARIGVEKIVGGPPEPPVEEKQEDAPPAEEQSTPDHPTDEQS